MIVYLSSDLQLSNLFAMGNLLELESTGVFPGFSGEIYVKFNK